MASREGTQSAQDWEEATSITLEMLCTPFFQLHVCFLKRGSKEHTIFLWKLYLNTSSENLKIKFTKPSGLPTVTLVMGSLWEMPQSWLIVKRERWYTCFITINPKTCTWPELLHFWCLPPHPVSPSSSLHGMRRLKLPTPGPPYLGSLKKGLRHLMKQPHF